MKFYNTFWRHGKSLDTFRMRFWIFGAVLNRHRVADKTTEDKTQECGWKRISVKTLETAKLSHSKKKKKKKKTDSSEYVWFVKLHWKLDKFIFVIIESKHIYYSLSSTHNERFVADNSPQDTNPGSPQLALLSWTNSSFLKS